MYVRDLENIEYITQITYLIDNAPLTGLAVYIGS